MTRPKRSTSADVAREAGVSPTTVSYVMNNRPGQSIPEETRRRVLDAARRLEYHPLASARALAAGRSSLVLLSIPELPIGPSINRFVEELAASLAEHGLTLVTHLMAAHGRPLVEVCATLDASAVLGFEAFEQETVDALHRLGVTVVLPEAVEQSPLMTDVGRLQAEHLIGRGHRRIGYALPEHPGYQQMARERLRGVQDVCAEAGLTAPLALTASLEIAESARAVAQWREAEVTAVCAFHDETAMGVLAGLRQLSLEAPSALAVIGVDDIPTARVAAPPLTTVRLDLHEAGRDRAQAVIARLAGREPEAAPHSVSLHLVQRESA